MDALRLALVLMVVVLCVMAATRPTPPRRRVRRAPVRRRSPEPAPSRDRAGATLNRNRWDRLDLARAVGLDFADPQSVELYPSSSSSN